MERYILKSSRKLPSEMAARVTLRRVQTEHISSGVPRWRTFYDRPFAANAQALPPELPNLGGVDAPRPAAEALAREKRAPTSVSAKSRVDCFASDTGNPDRSLTVRPSTSAQRL
jgi:hypothetical protein